VSYKYNHIKVIYYYTYCTYKKALEALSNNLKLSREVLMMICVKVINL